jgi:large subunit ribosomal protein L30
MSQLRVTQVRSVIDRPKDQKDTVRRLGLRRMHHTVVKEDRPDIRGMLAKVRHLVSVEEIAEAKPTRSSRATRAADGEGDRS